MRRAGCLGIVLAFLMGSVVAASTAGAAPPADPGPSITVPGGGGTPHAGAVTGTRAPEASRTAGRASVPPLGYPVTGIDVASYQGAVNWAGVAAAGTSFALVKATEGTSYTNPYYGAQYTGALAAGLSVGSYAFGRPDAANPVQQADYLVTQSQPMTAGRTLPFMLDMESPYSGTGIPNRCWNLAPTAMVGWIRSFVDEVRARTGMPTIVYTNLTWWTTCTANAASFGDQLLDIAYWSAAPPTILPAGWPAWTFWQYADSGTLPGDQDVFQGTAAQLAALTYQAPAAVATGPFRDVAPTSPFAADISWLVSQQITTGYPDGTFHPGAPVQRQAMAAFLYRYLDAGATAPPCTGAPFRDVSVANPFCGEIAALKARGVLKGFTDGTFRPGTSIDRQATASFVYRLANVDAAPACTRAPFTDVSRANPFCGAIAWLVANRIAAGYSDGSFHPTDDIARQAMAAFLHRLSAVAQS